MSEPMKVNMLGRDIVVTREALLSDGYCLSTVKHAERLASGPDTYVVTQGEDGGPSESGGALWLRGHIPFCTQCSVANKIKIKITDYIRRHFPTRLVDWNQGRMPAGLMGQIVTALVKADREFMSTAIGFSKYNQQPLHLQAISDRNSMVTAAKESGANDVAEAMGASRVILVDTDVLFEAWQLLGSGPLYEKERLLADFDKMKIMTPFPSTYLAFSEGINRHLVEHFFDNMPADVFDDSNIKGVLFYNRSGARCGVMESDIKPNVGGHDGFGSGTETGPRIFLWVTLLRAIQDKVFMSSLTPESAKERDEYIGSFASGMPDRMAPEPFYAVRVNPNSSFRDPARVYGKRHINWTHRWEVAGHWRTYKDGKRVWISSYVKGPDDKPFVPSVRVYGEEIAAQAREHIGKMLLGRFMAWVRSFRSSGK